jgi:hypothetical protein
MLPLVPLVVAVRIWMTVMPVNYAILHVRSVRGQVWVAAALAGMVNHFLADQEDFAGTDIDQGKQPKRGFLVNYLNDSTAASTELISVFHRRWDLATILN